MAGLPLSFTGGNAQGSTTANSGGAQNINFNPAFNLGGTQTSNPSNSGGATATPTADPSMFGLPPAGAGLATLNTTLPGSASAMPALSSNSLMLILIIGAALLLLSGGKR